MTVIGAHHPALVMLSILIASSASFSALQLAGRTHAASGITRLIWRMAAAVVMGGGIWSMHFVAMLAFSLPGMTVHYDVELTLLSLVLPIGVTGLGFFTVELKGRGPVALTISGILMGAGVVTMHYTGMAAMHSDAELSYDAFWVSVSILIAIGASVVGLWIAFRNAGTVQQILAAGVMGLAVSGMHYAAMKAAIFTTGGSVDEAQGHAGVDQTSLALAVAGLTFMFLLLASAATAYDRHLSGQKEREQAAGHESELAGAHAAANIQLREAIRRAEQASQAKTDFLSAMSHEIRTPMTGMLGMADLLATDNLTSRQMRYVDGIRASGRHLLNIINDILDFSRIETGKLDLEHIDFSLSLVFERLRSLMQPQAIERGLHLRFELSEHSPLVLKGDPTRLNQVLLNLVHNAIKFTERGIIAVSASPQPLDDGRLCFCFEVRDTGIGIAREVQAEIFTAFTQGDRSTARRFGGSGLGLAISKRLVEAMGGEIGVDSLPGVGSVFWFKVPFELGDPANLEEAAHVQFTKAHPRRILVAEDVKINRAFLGDMLTREGHDPVFAENGAEAVALAEKERFDLILMDVQMPVMDGIEATRRIRQMDGPMRDVPILALTANVMAQEQERYLAAGMTECLMKPIDWDQLHKAISRYGGDAQVPASLDVSVPEEVGEAPLVDRQRLGAFRASMSSEQLASWLRRSIGDAERTCERMATLPQGSEDLRREAHSLKGTAGTFGLMRISQIAAGIEEKARDGGGIEPLLADLKDAVAATRSGAMRDFG